MSEILSDITSKVLRFFYQTLAAPHTLWSVALVILVLAFDLLLRGWHKSAFGRLARRTTSARDDCIWYAIHITGMGALAIYPLFMLINYLGSLQTPTVFAPTAGTLFPNGVVDYVIFVVVLDFSAYVAHVLMHKVPVLWVFHKVHHSALEFNALTTSRSHLVDVAVFQSGQGAVALLLGASPAEIGVLAGARLLHMYLVHTNFNCSLGWFGRWLVVSPNAHRIHHSNARQHFDSNFGGTFIFWDRIFSTFRTADVESLELGLGEDSPYNSGSFGANLLRPFRELFSQASNSRR